MDDFTAQEGAGIPQEVPKTGSTRRAHSFLRRQGKGV